MVVMTKHAYIAECKAQDPTTAAVWDEIEALHDDKLWHQLTDRLVDLTRSKYFATLPEQQARKFYTEFLSKFEKYLNRLTLVELVLCVCDRYGNQKEAIDFLCSLAEKVKDDVLATVLLQVHVAELELHQLRFDECWTILAKCTKDVDGIRSLHPRVHGSLYRISSDYHKAKANFAEYYRDSLSYLGCVDIASIPNVHQRACDLALAALVADNIYNFGELISHDVFKVLEGTPEAWLIQLVSAFNVGDLKKFEQLEPQWRGVEDLNKNAHLLKHKICLLCLMEIVFRHPDADRRLNVSDIAAKVELSVAEAEFLIMKALSLQLIKGEIDQVESIVHVTWVKPRVLTKEQLAHVATRMNMWARKVGDLSAKLPAPA